MTDKQVIGAFEQVSFPEYGLDDVVAKIDTGAYSGALHCTKIETYKDGRKTLLKFSPFDHPEIIVTTDDFKTKHVKSSNGIREERYFVTTTICIDNNPYTISMSLANRSEMRWPVLIGRSFLKKNRFLVDSSKASRYGKT
ncbi:MAG: RimK/LysX family protein [Candidatus Saccharibacteria bacterium]|nr:RimK/LysX family protein [Candidatus Saccharibacteria bacterium]